MQEVLEQQHKMLSQLFYLPNPISSQCMPYVNVCTINVFIFRLSYTEYTDPLL
jgi:hypothetical protein